MHKNAVKNWYRNRYFYNALYPAFVRPFFCICSPFLLPLIAISSTPLQHRSDTAPTGVAAVSKQPRSRATERQNLVRSWSGERV